MKNKNTPYYIVWAVMYLLCALLSFLPEPHRSLKGLMTLLSLAFFVPPALLLYRSIKDRAAGTVQLLLWLSVGSLVLTFVLLLLNFLSFGATQAAGSMVYWLLVLVSVPMVCSGAWVLSLFLWALLLMVCLKYRKMEN